MTTKRGGVGWGEVQEEGDTHICIVMADRVAAGQKPTQHYKAITHHRKQRERKQKITSAGEDVEKLGQNPHAWLVGM